MEKLKEISSIIGMNTAVHVSVPDEVNIELASKQLLVWHLEKQREMIRRIVNSNTPYKNANIIQTELSEQIEELKK
jgi:exosome complex RNA-binding protein Rrp4